jgi:hypothetical protein
MTQLTDLQRCLAQPRLDGPSAEQVATLTLARVGGSLARLSPAGRWLLFAGALMTPQCSSPQQTGSFTTSPVPGSASP